jgi:hypothetical protein
MSSCNVPAESQCNDRYPLRLTPHRQLSRPLPSGYRELFRPIAVPDERERA